MSVLFADLVGFTPLDKLDAAMSSATADRPATLTRETMTTPIAQRSSDA